MDDKIFKDLSKLSFIQRLIISFLSIPVVILAGFVFVLILSAIFVSLGIVCIAELLIVIYAFVSAPFKVLFGHLKHTRKNDETIIDADIIDKKCENNE